MRDHRVVREIERSDKGCVLLARRRDDDTLVVLKERLKAELGRGRSVSNEVELLRKVVHPNLIRLRGHFWEGRQLVMELEFAAHGDLKAELARRAPRAAGFGAARVVAMMAQLLSGLSCLHEHRIVHRDLKSANIFIAEHHDGLRGVLSEQPAERCVLKIGDLGVSREMSGSASCMQTYCGTPLYASPEICDNRPYGKSTDVWSLGVLFYELVALRHPFPGPGLLALASQIASGKYEPPPPSTPPPLVKLVASMLRLDPASRPSAARLLAAVEQLSSSEASPPFKSAENKNKNKNKASAPDCEPPATSRAACKSATPTAAPAERPSSPSPSPSPPASRAAESREEKEVTTKGEGTASGPGQSSRNQPRPGSRNDVKLRRARLRLRNLREWGAPETECQRVASEIERLEKGQGVVKANDTGVEAAATTAPTPSHSDCRASTCPVLSLHKAQLKALPSAARESSHHKATRDVRETPVPPLAAVKPDANEPREDGERVRERNRRLAARLEARLAGAK